MDRKQVEAFARVNLQAFNEMLEQKDLATRQDLETGLARVERLILENRAMIAEMETRMTKAFHNTFFGFVAAVAAIAGGVFSLMR